MIALPFLEYNLSHPHPKGHWFLIATIIIFLAITPVLVLVNFATLGFELVPELQTEWRNINEPLDAWWGTRRLPLLLRPRTPRCEPKDIGRGDTFRLTGSLFDYTVMSSWNKTDHTDTGVQQQARVVYTGQSFADCYVTNARYDYSMGDQAHSVTIGVFCPGYDDYRVEMTMQTTVTFARELTKDFIGQYYGGGLDLMNIAESTDYRKTVLAVMEVIATDALSILRKPNLPIPLLSMRLFFRGITAEEAILSDTPETSNVVYVNGTQPEEAPEEVFIYINSVFNLVYVVMDAVNLDLGNIKPPNMFRNKTRFPEVVFSNKAPTDPPINNITNWAKGGATSFYYGRIPDQYQTWAETLLAGQPENITLTDTTGPPRSVMATTYLCPRYQLKPTNALLTSVFVGAATMTLSVWGAWMFFTAFLARRIMAPQVICYCDDCKARRLREAIRTEGIRQRRAAMRESNSIIARFMAFMGIDGRRERTVYPPESDLEDQEYPAVPHSGRPMLAEASDNKKVSYLSGSPTGEK